MLALRHLIDRAVARLRPYPYQVSLPLPGHEPLRFLIHNPIERYRTVEYGGERTFWEQFLSQLRSDDLLYDIGASVGLFALGAARICKDVYAFEPDPETRSRLTANAALNNLLNIHMIPWAVSDRAGSVELYSDGAAGFAPSLAKQSRANAPSGSITVATNTLDAAIASGELPLPTVLKIDIEGAEVLCLRGAQRLLAGEFGPPPRLIALELHPPFLPSFGASVADIDALIDPHGYELRESQPRADQEHRWYYLRSTVAQ